MSYKKLYPNSEIDLLAISQKNDKVIDTLSKESTFEYPPLFKKNLNMYPMTNINKIPK